MQIHCNLKRWQAPCLQNVLVRQPFMPENHAYLATGSSWHY
jgi:hypothetical protein